jgi:uridine kinase
MTGALGAEPQAASIPLEVLVATFAATVVHRLRAAVERPFVVGVDGRSGSGKSTLVAAAAARLAGTIGDGTIGDGATVEVAVIEGDQFYAGGSAHTWDQRSAAVKAATGIDWRRQRAVLESLRRTGSATWRRFDFEAIDWDAEPPPLAADALKLTAGDVVILEGAYSCRPELHDLLDVRVLLDVPTAVRRRQLLEREGAAYRADWESRWSEAEDHYFGTTMPATRFDVVLGRS